MADITVGVDAPVTRSGRKEQPIPEQITTAYRTLAEQPDTWARVSSETVRDLNRTLRQLRRLATGEGLRVKTRGTKVEPGGSWSTFVAVTTRTEAKTD